MVEVVEVVYHFQIHHLQIHLNQLVTLLNSLIIVLDVLNKFMVKERVYTKNMIALIKKTPLSITKIKPDDY